MQRKERAGGQCRESLGSRCAEQAHQPHWSQTSRPNHMMLTLTENTGTTSNIRYLQTGSKGRRESQRHTGAQHSLPTQSQIHNTCAYDMRIRLKTTPVG